MHLICPPKFCIKHIVFHFSWDGSNTQEKRKTKLMKNFGRQIRCIMGDVQVANCSLRKQPTFRYATGGLLAKWRLRNERRNSILMTHTTQFCVQLLIGWKFASSNQRHYPDLGWDRSWVWNFCARFLQAFRGKTTGGVPKWRLFSQSNDSTVGSFIRNLFMHAKPRVVLN